MRGSVRRALSEFFAIVVGVLVALSLDAGWDRYQERVREREILDDLRQEFSRNLEILEADAEDNEPRLRTANYILELTTDEIRELDADSALILLRAALGGSRFDGSNATLRSVIEAGEFKLISDPDLRSKIAAWMDGRDELARKQSVRGDWISERMMPYIADHPLALEGPQLLAKPQFQSRLRTARDQESIARTAELQLLEDTRALMDALAAEVR